MKYIRLRKCCFTFMFMLFVFIGSEISMAKMFGKVATLPDIETMLNEFKSCYKDTLFSTDEKIRNSSWQARKFDDGKVQLCSKNSIKDYGKIRNEDDFNLVLNFHKECISLGKMFCCRDVSSWCLNWLESKNFICGLLFRDDYERTNFVTTGFHWAVILPILDDNNCLDVWVIELSRWKPDGYTLTKILFDWRTFVSELSWRNFVVFRDSDLIGTVKKNDSKMKAMLASSWVWNIVKNLERKKIPGAKRWLLDETRKINEWLCLDKMNFGIWPCIVPFNKKIHDNPEKIGKTVNSILEIPSIKDSIFSAHHLPEFKEFEEVSFGLFYKKFTYLLKDKANEDTNKKMKPFFITPLRCLLMPKKENLFMKKNIMILEYKDMLLHNIHRRVEENQRPNIYGEYEFIDLDDEEKQIDQEIAELENKGLPKNFCEISYQVMKNLYDEILERDILYFEILLPKNISKNTFKRTVTPQNILSKKGKLMHSMYY